MGYLRLIAGSLESANSSILAARRHFKEVVGKKSGFYVLNIPEISNEANKLIDF